MERNEGFNNNALPKDRGGRRNVHNVTPEQEERTEELLKNKMHKSGNKKNDTDERSSGKKNK